MDGQVATDLGERRTHSEVSVASALVSGKGSCTDRKPRTWGRDGHTGLADTWLGVPARGLVNIRTHWVNRHLARFPGKRPGGRTGSHGSGGETDTMGQRGLGSGQRERQLDGQEATDLGERRAHWVNRHLPWSAGRAGGRTGSHGLGGETDALGQQIPALVIGKGR